MSKKQELVDRLTSSKGGLKVEDIKFSLGFDRFVSEEDFCAEIISAEDQIEAGLAVAIQISEVDGNFNARKIEDFLA